jgi:hypothetical protein
MDSASVEAMITLDFSRDGAPVIQCNLHSTPAYKWDWSIKWGEPREPCVQCQRERFAAILLECAERKAMEAKARRDARAQERAKLKQERDKHREAVLARLAAERHAKTFKNYWQRLNPGVDSDADTDSDGEASAE